MIRPAVRRLRAWRSQSLGVQLLLILAGFGLAGSIAISVLLSAVITPSFDQLEARVVKGHVDRTRAALEEYSRKVETAVRDYGDWNASYAYMASPTRAFEEESFATQAMINLDVAGMAYVAPDGHVVIARWIDPTRGRDLPQMRDTFISAIPLMELGERLRTKSSRGFYVRLDGRLVAVGAALIRRSDGTGAPRGYVLMARELTKEQLTTVLQLPALIDVGDARPNAAAVPHSRTIAIAVPILGADGAPVARARFAVSRDLSVLGRRMLAFAVIGAVLLFVVLLVTLSRLIGDRVVRPLGQLERHMARVSTSGTHEPLSAHGRRDEIGNLVTAFNRMMRQLADLSERVEMQSFKLGRHESAVAVMHNVRNALTPVSTILSTPLAPAADDTLVDRALAELATGELPAARQQKLVAFIVAALAADRARRDRQDRARESGRVALSHALEIIGRQQEETHEGPALATVDLTDVIARNAAIVRYADGASIAFSFPSQPHLVLANRVMLSQVIGNVFANAAEAIAARGGGSGTILVSIHEHDGEVQAIIRDDGEGFDPAIASTLFQRGYSTRKNKSGGLGLHWCANTMLAMGGRLQLDSEGPGRGACAILTLAAAVPVPTSQAA
jgi:signal transduction histidine kinase